MHKMHWYTVYERKSEQILVSGGGVQCAKALGMSMNTFWCTVSRCRSGKNRKYEIMIEDIEKE